MDHRRRGLVYVCPSIFLSLSLVLVLGRQLKVCNTNASHFKLKWSLLILLYPMSKSTIINSVNLLHCDLFQIRKTTGGGGGDLVPTMPRCVCPKVKVMGLSFALRV